MPPTSPAPLHPIAVIVRFDQHGRPTPLEFTWRGTTYTVESTGRRWNDDQGSHVLVMVPGGQVHELVFAAQDERWYLKRISPGQSAA